jgi:hypothetical protein
MDAPACPCSNCPKPPSGPAPSPDEGDRDCCVHVTMDVGVLWAATALDAPAAAGTAAPPPSSERLTVDEGDAEARVPCEEDSVVLIR